ncbi:MAG: DUF1611 domain-containing protein [Spirochaetota bacterium]
MKDGRALVYCEGYFNTPWGKTAHGLVRFTRRYDVAGVIDSRYAGYDAGNILDKQPSGIPLFSSIDQALQSHYSHEPITHLVFGIATDGGVLTDRMKHDILHAVNLGLNVDCGMHYFLSDDPELTAAAQRSGAVLRDVRKTPPRSELHSYTGRISEVDAFRVALLGTDSSVGKRTTAWKLVDALNSRGLKTEFIGTGQTAWLQGCRYGVMMDSLINDFVAGEIEHAIVTAWEEEHPQIMVIEGQGSLMNPLFPGGFEILSAGQPHAIIMQHAPLRRDYDGIPGVQIHPLKRQIEAVQLISEKPVVAITVNHEGMQADQISSWCEKIHQETGLPTEDALTGTLDQTVTALSALMKQTPKP